MSDRHPSYRYVILGLCLAATFAVWGVRYSLSILIDPLSAARGWSYGQTSLAASLFMLVSGVLQPPIGWLVDRFGARAAVAAGLVAAGAGLALSAGARELWQLYVSLGLVAAAGFSLSGQAAVSALISRWFDQGRGFALGLNNIGIQLTQLLWVPAAGLLIGNIGLDNALLVMGGLLVLGMAPVVGLFLRSDPTGAMTAPGGSAALPLAGGAAEAPLVAASGGGHSDHFRRADFWLLVAGLGNCGFTMAMVLTHLPGMFLRAGASPLLVTTSLAFAGATGLIGQISSGWVSDRLGRGQVLAFVYGFRAVAITALLLFPGVNSLMVFALVFGLGAGTFTITAAACGDFFGRNNVGKTYSWCYLSHQVLSMAGVWLGGWAVDRTGGYTVALVAAIFVSVAGAAVSAAIPWVRARLASAVGLSAVRNLA